MTKHRGNFPVGRIEAARMQLYPPPFIHREPRYTGRRASGIRYEAKVHQEFLGRYPGYLPSPWIEFYDRSPLSKWCQPDGLIIDPWLGRLIIVEVKYQHTPEAHEQLFGLYLPVLSLMFAKDFDLDCVEVVSWFDCAVLCSMPAILCEWPDRPHKGAFNVHIWKPRP